MKRNLALLLALVMVLSLFGCQPKDPVETKPGETKATDGTKASSETKKESTEASEKEKEVSIIQIMGFDVAFQGEMYWGDRDTVQRGPGTAGAALNMLGYTTASYEIDGEIVKLEDAFDNNFDVTLGIKSAVRKSLGFEARSFETLDKKFGTSESGTDYMVISGTMTSAYDETRDFSALVFLREKETRSYYVVLYGLAVKSFEEEPAYADVRELYDACFSKEELLEVMTYAGDHLKKAE